MFTMFLLIFSILSAVVLFLPSRFSFSVTLRHCLSPNLDREWFSISKHTHLHSNLSDTFSSCLVWRKSCSHTMRKRTKLFWTERCWWTASNTWKESWRVNATRSTTVLVTSAAWRQVIEYHYFSQWNRIQEQHLQINQQPAFISPNLLCCNHALIILLIICVCRKKSSAWI